MGTNGWADRGRTERNPGAQPGYAGLGALGDPTRRAIIERLSRAPCSVGDLAADLPVSRPAVSQHLRTLKEAGLVIDRPRGTRRIYQVDPRGVAALRDYFDRLWGDALAAFAAATREPETGCGTVTSGTVQSGTNPCGTDQKAIT